MGDAFEVLLDLTARIRVLRRNQLRPAAPNHHGRAPQGQGCQGAWRTAFNSSFLAIFPPLIHPVRPLLLLVLQLLLAANSLTAHQTHYSLRTTATTTTTTTATTAMPMPTTSTTTTTTDAVQTTTKTDDRGRRRRPRGWRCRRLLLILTASSTSATATLSMAITRWFNLNESKFLSVRLPGLKLQTYLTPTN